MQKSQKSQKSRDPRWNPKLILPTLIFQFVAVACLAGLSGAFMFHNFYVSICPLVVAALGLVSALTQLICWATGSLHPLVVLTLACEWMVVWLGATMWVAFIYALDTTTCGKIDDYYYYNDDQGGQETACRNIAAIFAFLALTTISYIWLVAYSAVVRKRTRMPFVPRSADC